MCKGARGRRGDNEEGREGANCNRGAQWRNRGGCSLNQGSVLCDDDRSARKARDGDADIVGKEKVRETLCTLLFFMSFRSPC